jgi:hypothetical protein
LGDRDEIRSAEEVADFYLVLQRLARNRAELAGKDILFFVVEPHEFPAS